VHQGSAGFAAKHSAGWIAGGDPAQVRPHDVVTGANRIDEMTHAIDAHRCA